MNRGSRRSLRPAGGAQGVAHGNRGSNIFLIGWSKSTKLHELLLMICGNMIGMSFEIKISAFPCLTLDRSSHKPLTLQRSLACSKVLLKQCEDPCMNMRLRKVCNSAENIKKDVSIARLNGLLDHRDSSSVYYLPCLGVHLFIASPSPSPSHLPRLLVPHFHLSKCTIHSHQFLLRIPSSHTPIPHHQSFPAASKQLLFQLPWPHAKLSELWLGAL